MNTDRLKQQVWGLYACAPCHCCVYYSYYIGTFSQIFYLRVDVYKTWYSKNDDIVLICFIFILKTGSIPMFHWLFLNQFT